MANGHAQRVVIETLEHDPDVLARIALLNSAFLRVLTGARLIEVIEADYRDGRIEFIVEDERIRPSVEGAVSVRYAVVD